MFGSSVLVFLRQYKVLLILFVIFALRLFILCDVFTLGIGELSTCEKKVLLNSTNSKKTVLQKIIENYTFKFRKSAARKIKKYFPSPHSELLLGLIFGINDLNKVPTFNDVLRSTGTIHVVVVSGYNISLVFTLVIGLLGSKYKLRNLITALVVTLVYAVIAGFDPPVVRAYIMGSIVAIAKIYGRLLSGLKVLTFSALLMLVIAPSFILSLSFQLSFLATLGLILYSPFFEVVFPSSNVLVKDLVATLSAQVLVWPLISVKFEQVSLISPIVNALILWTIPLATILGGVFAFLMMFEGLLPSLPKVFYFIAIVPHDIFVRAVYFFSYTPYSVIHFKPSSMFIYTYYILALLSPLILMNKLNNAYGKT